jgi:cell division initiation protein
MRISPLDIRKQAFKKSMRGVDAEEVRIFLDLVATEYEKILQDNAMMAERLHYQEDRLNEYRELEKSMRNSLVTADRIAAESRDASEREAQRIVQDAHLRAERILEDARERLQVLIREIELLKGKKEIYARRFWALVESQIGVLQEHMQDSGEIDALRRRIEQLGVEQARVSPAEPVEDEVPAGPPRGIEPRKPPEPGPRETRSLEQEGWPVEAGAGGRQGPRPRSSEVGTGLFGASDALPREVPSAEPAGIRGLREPEVPAYAGDPEEAEDQADRRRTLPRGLSRLLRGRQQAAPGVEERTGPADRDSGPPEDPDPERGGFFSVRERREGFFQISAQEERPERAEEARRQPEERG